ncbi:GFA family protein [Shewanella sp. 1_MG-2023]|uniref:GFA family protein n=1 Tax=unclassified Shewanella TaxID=196818 RepID=UPI0026E46E1A|nr:MULTISPECIES: GFA family protein [unclassified Shewanella]MDO6610883.1 GFA family protein [Shewanella sp. 7_MG-2023]MDO6770266.1 GFA family protein [Shewanella sp. 2_MG-2023]MDO6793407.1 GFA family protein [Shewanella sp. 1_MG-2023]
MLTIQLLYAKEGFVTLEATCCCKQISISLSGEPEMNAVCNCTNCKQRTGSAFGISTYFKTDAVLKKSGDTKIYKLWHKEQNHEQNRHFCTKCGTTLYWTISTLPHLIGVAGGCFAESEILEPTHTLNSSKKCNWVNLPENWQVQG